MRKRSTGTPERIKGYHDLKEFVASLKPPRRIMIMVKAGAPVDAVIDQLKPLLSKGDIIIDGGNSLYQDTARRVKEALLRRPAAISKPFPKFTLRPLGSLTRGASVSIM